MILSHSLPYSDVTIYIFAILYLSSTLYVYRFLWPLRLGWLLVCCLYKEVYLQIFKRVSFWLHGCCGEWEGWARKPVNHTSWVAVVTPTDRPKSVCNRCVIELFCDVVYVVILPFWQFCWCRGFCHRTESDLFFFLFSYRKKGWNQPFLKYSSLKSQSKFVIKLYLFYNVPTCQAHSIYYF